jgi:hypothetical protein
MAPNTAIAPSDGIFTLTIDPDQIGATGLITDSLGPGPRRHPKDKAKVKRRRKLAKASRRRNRK